MWLNASLPKMLDAVWLAAAVPPPANDLDRKPPGPTGQTEFERGLVLNHVDPWFGDIRLKPWSPHELKRQLLTKWSDHVASLV